jgi:hypothetical protein
MRNFLKDINSLYWWLSVVVVGIIINVTSSYLKIKLDRRLSAVSLWWRNRSESQKAKRAKTIAKLRSDAQAQTILATSILEDIIDSVYFLLCSFAALSGWTLFKIRFEANSDSTIVFLQVLLLVISAICLFSALHHRTDAIRKRWLLSEARNTDPYDPFDV